MLSGAVAPDIAITCHQQPATVHRLRHTVHDEACEMNLNLSSRSRHLEHLVIEFTINACPKCMPIFHKLWLSTQNLRHITRPCQSDPIHYYSFDWALYDKK